MNPIDTARRASADHAARHPDAGFYALPGQLRDLGDPWEHLRADAQRQLDRAQVSALLDTAGVPAHADLAERVTMLVEHDREMAADGLRLAKRSGPPHDWSVLNNGDCEGDGEPEIHCDGCGEEGYRCYCRVDYLERKWVCPYCGTDCKPGGCHTVNDPDDRPMDVASESGPAPKTTQHIRRLPHGPDGPAGPVLCGSPEGLTQFVYPFESSDANCPECLRLVTDVPIDERI